MITMTTNHIAELLKDKLPLDAQFVYNGYLDMNKPQGIGVFLADGRLPNTIALGGLDCTTVRVIPVSIKLRWGTNTYECDTKATEIYDMLLQLPSNFTVGETHFAMVELEDACPINIGRDDHNICESVIRANFHYYI